MSKISHFQIILFVNKKPNRLTLLKDVCLFWMLKIWASFWLFVVEIVVAVYCHADLFNYRYFSKFIFKFLQKGGICPICKPSDPPSPSHLPHQVNYRRKLQFANTKYSWTIHCILHTQYKNKIYFGNALHAQCKI